MHGSHRFEFTFKYLVTLGLIIYIAILNFQFKMLRPDHIFLVLLMVTLTFYKRKTMHLFLIDWLPMLLFLMFYDMMRGVAPMIYKNVHIAEPLHWERALFGWLAGGEAPTLPMADWLYSLRETWYGRTLTSFFACFYLFHFLTPLIFMWILWHKQRDRRMFYRFTYTLTVLNFLALGTFIHYPTAPPWYYDEFGLLQPSLTKYGGAPGGLLVMDSWLQIKVFATVWATFNPNYFAAVPSLHIAWPVTICLFTVLKFGRKWLPIFIYPVVVGLGGAFLNQHYFVDYLIALGYIGAAYGIVEKVLLPFVFDRFIKYDMLKR